MKLDLLTSLSVNSRFIQPMDVYMHVSSIKTVNTFLGLKLMTVASFSKSPRQPQTKVGAESAISQLCRGSFGTRSAR